MSRISTPTRKPISASAASSATISGSPKRKTPTAVRLGETVPRPHSWKRPTPCVIPLRSQRIQQPGLKSRSNIGRGHLHQPSTFLIHKPHLQRPLSDLCVLGDLCGRLVRHACSFQWPQRAQSSQRDSHICHERGSGTPSDGGCLR
jgi:hypothetical protein